jgi:hypothetical protein
LPEKSVESTTLAEKHVERNVEKHAETNAEPTKSPEKVVATGRPSGSRDKAKKRNSEPIQSSPPAKVISFSFY